MRIVKILSNQIDPNDEMIYKWIVHIFDMEKYDVLMKENREIESLVAKAQRENMRNAFTATVLAGVDAEIRNRLEALITTNKQLWIESWQPRNMNLSRATKKSSSPA